MRVHPIKISISFRHTVGIGHEHVMPIESSLSAHEPDIFSEIICDHLATRILARSWNWNRSAVGGIISDPIEDITRITLPIFEN